MAFCVWGTRQAVSGTVTASYASGDADGGDGGNDAVGGLVGYNDGTITASYAGGAVDGGDGDFDCVGGLVGFNNNSGTITASYASGDVDGGDGDFDRVGGLVGLNRGTITTSYGFGTATGEAAGVDRSSDASPAGTVANAAALTAANSSVGADGIAMAIEDDQRLADAGMGFCCWNESGFEMDYWFC